MTLTHPHAILLCRHVMSATLIPLILLIMFVAINVVALAAALAAALIVAHPVVIAVVIPLVLATTTLLGTMISPPALQKPFLIAKLANIAVVTDPSSHMDID